MAFVVWAFGLDSQESCKGWTHRVHPCSLEQNHKARLFEVPQWMFESDACCQVHSAEEPAVNCAALLDLKLVGGELLKSRSYRRLV